MNNKIILFRYLNSQLVKNRQINDTGGNTFYDYGLEFTDQPIVEIGEVN